MKTLVLLMATLLVVAGSLYAQQTQPSRGPTPGAMPSTELRSEIIAFDNEDFQGDHTHIFGDMKRLGKWDNSISSMIVLSGTWHFYDDQDMKGTMMKELGPGMYPRVTEVGIKDNSISSIHLASPAASRAGAGASRSSTGTSTGPAGTSSGR